MGIYFIFLIGFIIFIVICLAFAFIYSLSNEKRDFGDDFKLVISAAILLFIILGSPFAIVIAAIHYNLNLSTVSPFLILALLIFSGITVPIFFIKQRRSILKDNPKKHLPLNPLIDVKKLLPIIKPDEEIQRTYKIKSVLIREGGKITQFFSNTKSYRLPETFPTSTLIETNKAYYVDRRKSIVNYGIILFCVSSLMLLGSIHFLFIAFGFVSLIISLTIFVCLLVIPYRYVRRIEKTWITTEEKNNNTFEIEGVYPRGAKIMIQGGEVPLAKLQFHYKYQIL